MRAWTAYLSADRAGGYRSRSSPLRGARGLRRPGKASSAKLVASFTSLYRPLATSSGRDRIWLHVWISDIIFPLTSQKDTQMTVGTLAPPASSPVLAPFPAAAVEATLRSELVEAVKAEASIKGVALSAAPADIAKATFQVDSLVVVSILCAVERIIGFELPESVVRTGGYTSVDSALAQLLPRIEAKWKKQKGSKP